ncbi:MAG: hypothetical protein PHC54_02120 [Candidatus Omnitrophica bacterium]|nr:hypothetical protein [Candidatus Omnitrophota bacterium]MDD5592090.1 hypothetical protein [Candidatus Omnitrophota bacterium]
MKIKTILIILIGSLIISLLINLQAYMAKKSTEIEINALRNENGVLSAKIDEAARNHKQLGDKISALSNDLAQVSQERESLKKEKADIQELYEAVAKEKEALIEKIKTQEALKEEQKKPLSLSDKDSYWAGILKAKADLETQLEKTYSQLQTAQGENERLRQEKKNLELELASQKDIVDSMALELVQKNKDSFQLEEALKPLRDKNEILKLQLRALNKERNKLEGQLQELRAEKATMDRHPEPTRIESRAGSTPPPATKESVELPPIIVRLQSSGVSASAASPDTQIPVARSRDKGKEAYSGGSILTVNRENNFVVVNLGRSAGIEVGNTMQVYRGASPIATIEVIQVRESISACNIKEEVSNPQVGDTVR